MAGLAASGARCLAYDRGGILYGMAAILLAGHPHQHRPAFGAGYLLAPDRRGRDRRCVAFRRAGERDVDVGGALALTC
jgi:hypothetical protein